MIYPWQPWQGWGIILTGQQKPWQQGVIRCLFAMRAKAWLRSWIVVFYDTISKMKKFFHQYLQFYSTHDWVVNLGLILVGMLLFHWVSYHLHRFLLAKF